MSAASPRPGAASPRPADEDENNEDFLWAKERECLLLLLESRKLLSFLVAQQQKKLDEELDGKAKRRALERKLNGDLSCMEIGDILKREPGGDDMDYNSELARLKRLVIQEIKRNHVLEGQLAQMDLKISLMIAQKSTTLDMAAKRKEAWLTKLAAGHARKKEGQGAKPKYDISQEKIDAYGELFYTLQTEPKYLAKVLFLLQPTQVETFLDSTIITLFGEAFAPREEFLLLQLFQASMEQEINVVKNVQDFLSPDSVIPKLLVTYNRRLQGMLYLRSTLPEVIKLVQDQKDLNLEINPIMVAQEMGKQMTEEQAYNDDAVKAELSKRIRDLERVCGSFIAALYTSMDKLPYGLRWICKMMRELCEKQLPDSHPEDILRLTGYFVYYRFVNVALLNPESYKIVTKELGMKERKNLVLVGKVLQKAFNLKPFSKTEKSLQPLNPFLEKQREPMIKYFNQLVQVTDPEDFLQVDQYLELTAKEKPQIYINLNEIVTIHKLVHDKIDSLAGMDDPLRVILKDLGAPPEGFDESDARDIQLTLQNRFKQEIKEEEANNQLYAETKELMIPVLRAIPSTSSVHVMTLIETLNYGADWAKTEKNKVVADQIATVLRNLEQLTKVGMVQPADDYAKFVHDVAIEVANRASIRERQKKEIARLTLVLQKLKKQTSFTEEQIRDYEKYLSDALKKQYEGKKEKALHKPQKFSYKKLAQMGTIVDSEIPEASRKGCKLIWTCGEPGVFVAEVQMKSGTIEPMTFTLDELLDKHYNHVDVIERDVINFDVNMTLYLINKHILT